MPSINRVRFASLNISIIVLSLLVFTTHSNGQTTQSTTDKMTPSGIQPGAPAGSYPLSGLESINLYNGNLDFRLPLLSLDGRGSAVRNMVLSINTKKWRVRESHTQSTDTYTPTTLNWGGIDVGYLTGKLQGRQSGWDSRTCTNPQQTRYHWTNTNLTFVAPDGTEYALRDQLTDGQPMLANQCGGITGASRGTIFKSSDGSGVTFISDSMIFDKTTIPTGIVGSWNLIVSGYLLLRDGTRYRIDSGDVTWIRDRNGNLVYSQTDAINRSITMTTLADGSDQITYKGYQGALRTITITHTLLGSALRTGYSLQTHAQLFPELLGGYNLGTYNPSVVSSVILPDGRSYQFRYNSYGELARVVLPTGGAIEYDMTSGSGVIDAEGSTGLGHQIYRRVIERRTYIDGTTLEGRTTYTVNGATTTVSSYSPTGTLLAREDHSFAGSAASSLFSSSNGAFYSDWHDGKELSTSYYAADGITVLKRVVNTWEQRAPVSWYPTLWSNAGNEPENDPRITQTVTTLVDTNQVSKTTYSYDQYNNRTDSYEYDYGAGVAGALVRRTHIDYVTTNPVNGVDYTATGVYLRSLPSQTSVYDAASVERSRTTFEYDNYTAVGNHSPLTDRANISGHDSGFTTGYATRGNVTAITNYLLTNGNVSGSVTAYSQFDIAGNITKTIDGRGYATTIEYDDRFGSADGEARSNTSPSELAGLSSFAFPTKLTNALGHTVYGQFEYYLGQAVEGEDINGVVTSGYYNDALDRPTQVRRAVGTGVVSQSTFNYNDPTHTITVSSDQYAYNDNALVTKTLYDGLGRTTETQQYEGGTNYIAVQTQYDALGRTYKTSDPFRPWKSETPVWTTELFDGMGRSISVTTPDSAVVGTSYSGNTVTVTDQAGKKRKSVTDALGRLVNIYEDPNGLNYQTTYLYDTLDNLVKVTQGSQQRFFMYDSLKRLLRADNPEQENLSSLDLYDPISDHGQWSVKYDYDSNGNLTAKTDARGVVTQNSYDALNRVTTVSYRVNGQPDPNTGDIEYLYDNASYGKGRLWLTYRWGAKPSQTAVGYYDAMGRVKQLYNMFGDGLGGWSAGYEVDCNYNLAGQVTSQTYPSGHTVSYAYDSAGRTSSFTGNLGEGVTRSYASSFVYNSRSQVTQELFGTATQLYHKLQYNSRGQLWDIRVSTNSDVNGSMNRGGLQYFYDSSLGYGTSGPDNNGNVLFANTYTPEDELDQHWAIHRQSYAYDSLNRLKSVTEYFVNYNHPESQQSVQTYNYDPFGNRTINAALTSGAGINNTAFEVETARNRLYSPGDLAQPQDDLRRIRYDKAGNQIKDTYTGSGTATYDADNRIVAIQDKFAGTSTYTYNANAQRVRRKINNQETWQIYGIDGELLAEYPANGAVGTPQKEYGYRDGQLLITAEPAAAQNVSWTNAVGVSVNGNSLTKTAATGWGNAGASSTQSVAAGDAYVEATATETTTARLFGFSHTDADQSWPSIQFGIDLDLSGSAYVFESGNNRGNFGPYAPGDKFQVAIVGGVVKYKKNGTVFYTSSLTPSYPLIVDTALYQAGTTLSNVVLSAARLEWLVPDHLGTPRIILDQTGAFANLKRHDYLPFGEELGAGTGGRTTTMGFVSGDGVRQQFTSKERDAETGLDYFLARYYSSVQGRFISADDFSGGPTELFAEVAAHNPTFYADPTLPQTLNKYEFTLNNPLRFIDPDGHQEVSSDKLSQAAKDPVGTTKAAASFVKEYWKGEFKALGNIGIGVNNLGAIALKRPEDIVQPFDPNGSDAQFLGYKAMSMLTLLAPALSEAGPAGILTAETKETTVVASETSNAASRSQTVGEMAESLSNQIGKNSVSYRTPNKVGHIDLKGKPHFDKPTGGYIPTPHVQERQLYQAPMGGRINVGRQTTRAATKADIRTARNIIQRRE